MTFISKFRNPVPDRVILHIHIHIENPPTLEVLRGFHVSFWSHFFNQKKGLAIAIACWH
jgi:hypothetical protein